MRGVMRMKKSDYDINCPKSKANNKAKERWQNLRNRTIELHSIYDFRLDDKQKKYFKNWLTNRELEELLCSPYEQCNWSEVLDTDNFRVHEYNGFVNRVIQEKSNSYYVEIKKSDIEIFNIEEGWFGFSGLNPIIPNITKCYKYAFQPYIPGNAIKVLYLDLDQPNTKWPTKVKLHVMVENNVFTTVK
jgi:hypothetical protein